MTIFLVLLDFGVKAPNAEQVHNGELRSSFGFGLAKADAYHRWKEFGP